MNEIHRRRNVKELNQNLAQKYKHDEYSDDLLKNKSKNISTTPKFNENNESGSNYVFASSNKQTNYMDYIKNDDSLIEVKNKNSNSKDKISNMSMSSNNKRPKSSIGN